MFFVELTYTKPVEEVDKVLEAHRAYLDRYFASGHFVACGKQIPRTGGIVMGRAVNREEMERILQEDPFYTEQVADYRIIGFAATKWSEGFEGFENA